MARVGNWIEKRDLMLCANCESYVDGRVWPACPKCTSPNLLWVRDVIATLMRLARAK